MCILCVRVKINKRSFEPFCVWILTCQTYFHPLVYVGIGHDWNSLFFLSLPFFSFFLFFLSPVLKLLWFLNLPNVINASVQPMLLYNRHLNTSFQPMLLYNQYFCTTNTSVQPTPIQVSNRYLCTTDTYTSFQPILLYNRHLFKFPTVFN